MAHPTVMENFLNLLFLNFITLVLAKSTAGTCIMLNYSCLEFFLSG